MDEDSNEQKDQLDETKSETIVAVVVVAVVVVGDREVDSL